MIKSIQLDLMLFLIEFDSTSTHLGMLRIQCQFFLPMKEIHSAIAVYCTGLTYSNQYVKKY